MQILEAYNWHGMTSNKTPKIYDNSHLFMSIHGKVLHISCIYLGLSLNIVAHINYIFSIQSVFPDDGDVPIRDISGKNLTYPSQTAVKFGMAPFAQTSYITIPKA